MEHRDDLEKRLAEIIKDKAAKEAELKELKDEEVIVKAYLEGAVH